ncbi:MAG TPA: hypothetical protein VKB30_06055 [Candidatus Limnocylindrales bacterium]|nr:hypothetical protein [Candidatus Limnocylindrales bacterium]
MDTLAGWVLVAGTVIGLAPVGNPSLLRIWLVPRAEHIAIVAAHRRGWYVLNGAFASATVATTAALAMLALVVESRDAARAGLIAGTAGYAVGGVLWCAMLAIRSRVTPALAGRGDPDPAARLLEEAQGGLFAAYVLMTAVALVVIGLALAVGGGVSVVVAGLAILVGVGALVLQLATGDLVPAVLYLPTLAIGIALLAGWT